MTHFINWSCKQHSNPFDCPDCIMLYFNKFDEYGIPIHDGGTSCIIIKYCPWCGKKLPKSKRKSSFAKTKIRGLKVS
jgi:hypothetical protein